MLEWFRKSLRTGCVTKTLATNGQTVKDLREPLALDGDLCDNCAACTSICPTKALKLEEGGQLKVNYKRCILCLRCVEVCQPRALTITGNSPLAIKAKEEAAELVRRVFGRSAHIRHVDSGSCNACDWEMNALLNPIYDLQQYGFDFVASPRHADILLVTGAPTKNLEIALRTTFEAAPNPKLVVAMGACACSGGIYQGAYATAHGVDQIVPVDVYIPGCPPTPEDIIKGLLLAVGRLGI